MRESDVRDLLAADAATPAPPSVVDLERAMRDGRRRRTTRRALLAGGTALGVSAVLGGVAAIRPVLRADAPDPAATTPPARAWPPGPNGALEGPTLPRPPARFDLLGQWAAFGWLPFTPATVSSRAAEGYVEIRAATPGQDIGVNLFLGSEVADDVLRTGGSATQAPPVAGRPARWVAREDRYDEFDEALQWQYVPGEWAQARTSQVKAGHPMPTGAERRAMLHRVASSVGLSATRRQRFPFTTDALPADLPLFRVEVELAEDGQWSANIYSGRRATIQRSTLSLTVKRTLAEWAREEPLPPADVDSSAISRDSVDGHRAFRMKTGDVDELTVWLPDHLIVSVAAKGDSLRQLGASGALGLYRAIRVLPDPATWSERPLG